MNQDLLADLTVHRVPFELIKSNPYSPKGEQLSPKIDYATTISEFFPKDFVSLSKIVIYALLS